MPTYATKSRSVVELDVFTGSDASAAKFGLRDYRVDSRETGDAKPPWSEVEREDFYSLDGVTPVPPGTAFARQVIETDGELIEGDWKPIGDVLALEGKYEAVALNRNRTNKPGANMKNPLGVPLRDSEGNSIQRPSIGEQDRDPWTGELMVDKSNLPILVVE